MDTSGDRGRSAFLSCREASGLVGGEVMRKDQTTAAELMEPWGGGFPSSPLPVLAMEITSQRLGLHFI